MLRPRLRLGYAGGDVLRTLSKAALPRLSRIEWSTFDVSSNLSTVRLSNAVFDDESLDSTYTLLTPYTLHTYTA